MQLYRALYAHVHSNRLRGILFSNSLRIKLMILKDQKIYYLHCEDLQREFLRPPLDKTPAAVKIYKFQMKVETKIAAFLAKLKRKLKAVKVTTTTSGLWVRLLDDRSHDRLLSIFLATITMVC